MPLTSFSLDAVGFHVKDVVPHSAEMPPPQRIISPMMAAN